MDAFLKNYNQSDFDGKARAMSNEELAFASNDLREVLDMWKDDKDHLDPTMQKWWAEFDAVTCERQKRAKKAA